MIKFDLGGIADHGDYKSVNLVGRGSIKANILDLDSFCEDNTVDEFYMSHTYEHISPVYTKKFIANILKKLKNNGKLLIIQTDIKKVINMYSESIIDFRTMRDIIFTPVDRRISNYLKTGKDLMGHKYMWGIDELKEELLYYGFSNIDVKNVNGWKFDLKSYFPHDNMEKYKGIIIPNLCIIGYKK